MNLRNYNKVFAICPNPSPDTCLPFVIMRVSLASLTTCFLTPIQISRLSIAPPPLRSVIWPLQFPLPCTLAASWNTFSSEYRGQHLSVDRYDHGCDSTWLELQTGATTALTPHVALLSSACMFYLHLWPLPFPCKEDTPENAHWSGFIHRLKYFSLFVNTQWSVYFTTKRSTYLENTYRNTLKPLLFYFTELKCFSKKFVNILLLKKTWYEKWKIRTFWEHYDVIIKLINRTLHFRHTKGWIFGHMISKQGKTLIAGSRW